MSIFDQVNTFNGGVHPHEYKNLTENSSLEIMPNPKQIILPLSQHIGKPAISLVKKKDIIFNI